MSLKTILLFLLAVTLAFAGGFFLANRLNRAGSGNAAGSPAANTSRDKGIKEDYLSEKEIRRKLAEAEKNPGDFDFQRNLGVALYRYASIKEDRSLHTEIAKLLERAHRIRPQDREVLLTLGGVRFELGQEKKSAAENERARAAYIKAIELDNEGIEARIGLALCYLYGFPPEPENAVRELRSAYRIEPSDKRTLRFLIETLVVLKEPEQARGYFEELRNLGAREPLLRDLNKLIASPQ